MIDLRTPVLSSIFAVDFLFLHPRIHDERCKDTKAIFVKDFSSLSLTLTLCLYLLLSWITHGYASEFIRSTNDYKRKEFLL